MMKIFINQTKKLKSMEKSNQTRKLKLKQMKKLSWIKN